MTSRHLSRISDVIFGICAGVVAVCVAIAIYLPLSLLVYDLKYLANLDTDLIMLAVGLLLSGLLTGVLLRDARRVSLICTSGLFAVVAAIFWLYAGPVYRDWTYIIPYSAGPVGLALSQINIHRKRKDDAPQLISGNYLAAVLAIGLFGAAILAIFVVPSIIDLVGSTNILLTASTFLIYALAALVVVLRLRKLLDWKK